MNPLIISVKKSTWRCHDPKSEASLADYAENRLKRLGNDRFTCQYCGFISVPNRHNDNTMSLQASGFLEVHHANDDHNNNTQENLISVCPFCHQVFHAGNAGYREAANVIYLPQLSQAEINLTMNLTMCAFYSEDSGIVEFAESLYGVLLSHEDYAMMSFNESILDASNLGAALMGLYQKSPELYALRGDILKGLRLLPNPDVFETHAQYWKNNGWMPDTQWDSVFNQWNNT